MKLEGYTSRFHHSRGSGDMAEFLSVWEETLFGNRILMFFGPVGDDLDVAWTSLGPVIIDFNNWTIPNEKPKKWTGFQPFPTGRDSHCHCHRDCHIKIPMLIRNRFALKFAVPPMPGVQQKIRHWGGDVWRHQGHFRCIFSQMRFFGMIWDAWDDAMRIEIIKYLRAAAPAADPGRMVN